MEELLTVRTVLKKLKESGIMTIKSKLDKLLLKVTTDARIKYLHVEKSYENLTQKSTGLKHEVDTVL